MVKFFVVGTPKDDPSGGEEELQSFDDASEAHDWMSGEEANEYILLDVVNEDGDSVDRDGDLLDPDDGEEFEEEEDDED